MKIQNSLADRTQALLYMLAFVSGMTTLAVEISTSRMISNVFGSSNIVWAAAIGMTLAYLMIGYFAGGRYADRHPHLDRLLGLAMVASLTAGTIPIISTQLLRSASIGLQRIDVAASIAAAFLVAILLAVPMTLLGAIPPFAIRLAVRSISASGKAVGAIYALTTAGSLLGTFIPVLVLIPRIGTPATFVVFSADLALLAILGSVIIQGRFSVGYVGLLVALGLVGYIAVRTTPKPPPPGTKLLYERETAYNYVQVVEQPDRTRWLLLNEGLATHSVYHPDRLATGQSWDYFLAGPYFNRPPFSKSRVKKAAILGLAGGTVARQYTAVYGPIPIDGVEIDAGIVEVGREYFGMTMPNLNVVVKDARFALGRLDTDYQMIGIDAYRPPYIPWQLTTREFFAEVRDHLDDDGVVVINVGRTNEDRRLVEAMTATMLTVFPTVHSMDVPASFNSILVATKQPTRSEYLLENLVFLSESNELDPMLYSALELAIETHVPTVASDLVFTDDLAPVERISDSIVLQFILGPDAGQLRHQILPTESP